MVKKKTASNGNQKILNAISDLAIATGGRFDRVDKRFDKVDTELQEIRHDIHRLETIVLQDHERRLEAVERKLGIGR